jgi:hypothetical protein
MKKFSIPEIIILILTIFLILLSEYYFFQGKHDKAIFLGLWPPTMLALLIYMNQKASK